MNTHLERIVYHAVAPRPYELRDRLGAESSAKRRATSIRKLRKLVRDDIPNQQQVDARISVNKSGPKNNNLVPGKCRLIVYRGRKTARSLTDYLEIAGHRVLDQPLLHEGAAPTGHTGFDAVR